MDVSFILSADELFTLISMMNGQTEAGKEFIEKALADAEICDLTGLKEKKLAHIEGDELELAPVMQMMIDTISNASNAENHGDYWEIESAWVTLRCEGYPFKEGYWKISPIKGAAV